MNSAQQRCTTHFPGGSCRYAPLTRVQTEECSMLFFGDNGQGDLMCAERLTGMNGSPSEDGVGGMVSAAFIHQAGIFKDAPKVSSFTEKTCVSLAGSGPGRATE